MMLAAATARMVGIGRLGPRVPAALHRLQLEAGPGRSIPVGDRFHTPSFIRKYGFLPRDPNSDTQPLAREIEQKPGRVLERV
jgi:hypothetical protein